MSDKLQTLNDDFAAMSKKKKDLEDNIDLCSQKLERAEKLIGGLGGERSRWGDLAAALEGRLDNVTGDVLLAAATVTYLGHLAPAGREVGNPHARMPCQLHIYSVTLISNSTFQ